MCASAPLSRDTATGIDGIVNEVWCELSLPLVARIAHLLRGKPNKPNNLNVATWKHTLYFAIKSCPGARNFDSFRFWVKLPTLQKWYRRAWRPQLRLMTRATPHVCTVGFKSSCSISMITCIISALLRESYVCGLPYTMLVGNVLSAFD